MAQQLFVVQRYGNTWANGPKVGECTVYPCLTMTPGKEETREERLRPTGERGSGPYFHSYVKPENGISHGWRRNNTIYADRMSYSERIYNTSPGLTEYFHDRKTFSNGMYYYEYNYQYGRYGSWRWCEKCEMYVVRWNGPLDLSDSSMYPRCVWDTKSYEFEHIWDFKPSKPQFAEFCWEQASKVISSILSEDIEEKGLTGEMVNLARSSVFTAWTAKVDNFGWKYGEATAFEWWRITGQLPPMFQSLANAAYVEACDSLPEAGCNSIATVLEVASSISDVLRGKTRRLKSIKDVWLNYRYVICTNKMDIAEYCEVTRRLTNLANQEKVTVHGSASYGDIICSCSIDVRLDNVLPKDAAGWLKTYGFKLSAVNVWDMVPYSFVVDWFFHVGEILETIEKMGNALEVPVEDCWFSFRSKYGNQDTFLRVPGSYAAAFPYLSYHKTSSKTVFKRILDAICLFT